MMFHQIGAFDSIIAPGESLADFINSIGPERTSDAMKLTNLNLFVTQPHQEIHKQRFRHFRYRLGGDQFSRNIE